MATKVTGEDYVKIDGQLFELKRQLRQPSGYPYDPRLLSRGLQAIIDGRFKAFEPPVINLDRNPMVIPSYTVHEHNRDGELVWNPKKVRLHLTKGDPTGRTYIGEAQRQADRLKPFNANLLDFFLEKSNWCLIPKYWFGKPIFFWGTIYADEHGRQMVRCVIFRSNGSHKESFSYLSETWYDDGYAAVAA